MAALGEGNVPAGAVGRVVGGMAVVRGHCVPKVLEGRSYSGSLSVSWPQKQQSPGALLLSHGVGRTRGSVSARDCAPPSRVFCIK